jgi:hypothetical protein
VRNGGSVAHYWIRDRPKRLTSKSTANQCQSGCAAGPQINNAELHPLHLYLNGMAQVAKQRKDHRGLTVCHFGARRQLVDNQVAQMSDIPHCNMQQQIVHTADVKHLENLGEPPSVRRKRSKPHSGISSEPHFDECLEGNTKRIRIYFCVESFENLGLR